MLTSYYLPVYTCQKPQNKRCGFFLWDDDAKPREASAVMNNSRSEPQSSDQPPRTPSRTSSVTGYQTPVTDSSSRFYSQPAHQLPSSRNPTKSSTKSQSTTGSRSQSLFDEDEDGTQNLSPTSEPFDWPSSDDEDLASSVDRATMPPPLHTPRKAAKLDLFATPETSTKRNFSEMSTPSTPRADFPITLSTETPVLCRFRSLDDGTQNSAFAHEVLDILSSQDVGLQKDAKDAVLAACNNFALRMQGVVKGREISREAVKVREERIRQLEERVSFLEVEKEREQAVNKHLKHQVLKYKESQ